MPIGRHSSLRNRHEGSVHSFLEGGKRGCLEFKLAFRLLSIEEVRQLVNNGASSLLWVSARYSPRILKQVDREPLFSFGESGGYQALLP